MSSWMQTASGRAYWPLAPRPEDVCIEDIAHALSMQCRYGGHSLRFYSVAEHSVHVSCLVPRKDALIGLLHDATEAYCVDVPRPLKQHLVGYAEIEYRNWLAIARRFGVSVKVPQSVHDADVAMLFAEQKAVLLPPPRPDWGMGLKTPIVADVKIKCLPPQEARSLFLRRFAALSGFSCQDGVAESTTGDNDSHSIQGTRRT